MARKLTIERILRDDDDSSGQSIRSWCIEAEDHILTISDKSDSGQWLMIRRADLRDFVADLYEVAGLKQIPCDLKASSDAD